MKKIVGQGCLFLLLNFALFCFATSNQINRSSIVEPLNNMLSGYNNQFNSITYGNNMFVAVGDGGIIEISPDGIHWKQESSITSAYLMGITNANGKFITVGSYSDGGGVILISSDGINWSQESYFIDGAILRNITYANNEFIAVGADSKWNALLLTSADGINWNQIHPKDPRYTPITYGGLLVNIIYINGKYMAIGGQHGVDNAQPIILSSSDLVNWDLEIFEGHGYLYGIAYDNNGKLAAVGGDYYGQPNIFISSNESNWVRQSSSIDSGVLSRVIYGNGKFIAVGYSQVSDVRNPIILTSADGISWTQQSSGIIDGVLSGITYGDNKFVATGYTSTGEGIILNSVDGVKWNKILPQQ